MLPYTHSVTAPTRERSTKFWHQQDWKDRAQENTEGIWDCLKKISSNHFVRDCALALNKPRRVAQKRHCMSLRDMPAPAGSGKRKIGGERGIRTPGTLRYTRFPSVRLQPLGHLSLFLAPPEYSNHPQEIQDIHQFQWAGVLNKSAGIFKNISSVIALGGLLV